MKTRAFLITLLVFLLADFSGCSGDSRQDLGLAETYIDCNTTKDADTFILIKLEAGSKYDLNNLPLYFYLLSRNTESRRLPLTITSGYLETKSIPEMPVTLYLHTTIHALSQYLLPGKGAEIIDIKRFLNSDNFIVACNFNNSITHLKRKAGYKMECNHYNN